MKAFFVNYNFTPTWLLESDLDYVIHDRSDSKDYLKDFPQERIVYEENVGNADYSKLCWLIDNYDNLPEVFLWGKANLFKYVTKEEFDLVKDNKTFTPLLTKGHNTYSDNVGAVCYYSENIYWERNPLIHSYDYKYFKEYAEFAQALQLPNPSYIPFAPGGNYILTRECVHRYAKDFYIKMASFLPYARVPLEAYFAERCYYTLWK